MSDSTARPAATVKVLVYSDDVSTRQQVILALGRRPHPDLPELEYVEVATEPVVIGNMDAGGIALAILDGEAVPAGGWASPAAQGRDLPVPADPGAHRPPAGRLARHVVAGRRGGPHPLDPIQLAEAVVALLRSRVPATT